MVDNAPSDARSRDVARRWGVQYVIEPVRGLSRARNRGARSCETEIIAYIDDDAVAEPDWLTVLARDFEDPLVAAVTGSVLPLQGSIETSLPCELAVPYRSERGQRRIIDQETPGWFEITNFGEMGDGLNMAFRRRVFDVWPGFEVKLGRGAILDGGEEHYAFSNLIERGYRMVYNPLAMVRHAAPRTTQEQRSRHLSVIATTTAYITYLAVEHPSCRRALARYLLDRLWSTARSWTTRPARASTRVVPRWLSLLAMFAGPWIYVRARMAGEPQAQDDTTPAENFATSPLTSTALGDRHSPFES